ncbi:neuronal PAS domain-containing protein 4A isoform X2 [Polyodon spathula]|uniref:neuronal PAS domain-containing protein 4A isoform X2 n=1 Tax=Polyodon spathula TaxID=7913 RepID=UPI001B7F4D64|nr:neuronal PAS domain-containing protein 4A isoform X2 [Polyodon spathula]
MYRSTKGASKARRDQINAEIRNLKDFLPISEADKSRLSYLHIMSLACMYTRKSVFFSQDEDRWGESGACFSYQDMIDFIQALPGFLLVVTSEGKLLYLSDNVTDLLGHSVVDLVAQGDSVYDVIDPSDHFLMRSNLALEASSETDRLFRCRFNTSKSVRRQSAGNKMVLIRGRFVQPPVGSYWSGNPVFIAYCSLLEPRPSQTENSFFSACFESQHGRDMAFIDASDSISIYLGYEKSSLLRKSWYSLVHPQDLSHASAKHYCLLNEANDAKVEMVVRLQSGDLCWVWVYTLLHQESKESSITAYNYIISDSQAWSLRQQLASEESQLAFVLRASASYQESLLLSPGQLSSPDQVFTPVSSTPTSSGGLSGQSFDFSGVYNVDCGPEFSSEDGAGSGSAAVGQEEAMQLGGTRGSISSIEEEPGSAPRPSHHHLDFYSQDCMFLPLTVTPPSLPPPSSSYDPSFRAKEFVCTPPYTPQQDHGGGCFLFGASEQALPPSAVGRPSETPTATTPTTTATTITSRELYFPLESTAYENLPPTPDSPCDGDCTVMALPEVRGPLYIDVPVVPEGLLTPEASPIKPPLCNFFGYLEKEKGEITVLMEHISKVAEGFGSYGRAGDFSSAPSVYPTSDPPSSSSSSPLSPPSYCKHDQLTRSSSLPPGQAPSSNLELFADCFYPIKLWKSADSPLLPGDGPLLFDENAFESFLKDSPSASAPAAPAKSGGQPVEWCPPPEFGGYVRGTARSPRSPDAPDPCVEVAHSSVVEETSPAAAASPPSTDLSLEERCFLEEIASYETVSETRASRSPCEGFIDELYQLQNHLQDSFLHDGSESNASF